MYKKRKKFPKIFSVTSCGNENSLFCRMNFFVLNIPEFMSNRQVSYYLIKLNSFFKKKSEKKHKNKKICHAVTKTQNFRKFCKWYLLLVKTLQIYYIEQLYSCLCDFHKIMFKNGKNMKQIMCHAVTKTTGFLISTVFII